MPDALYYSATKPTLQEAIDACTQGFLYRTDGEIGEVFTKPRKKQRKFKHHLLLNKQPSPDYYLEVEHHNPARCEGHQSLVTVRLRSYSN